MKHFNRAGERGGFTLVELLVYATIFSVAAVFLINILTSITATEVQQTAQSALGQQVSFVSETVQRLVRQSSLIENPAGVASSSLSLRMASSSVDRVVVWADAAGVYETVWSESGASTTVPLTDPVVATVSHFEVVKYESGSQAVAHVDLALTYNTSSAKGKISRAWKGAISRVSAATFDSDLMPNANNDKDVGTDIARWKNGYFAGIVNAGTLGVGVTVTPPGITDPETKMKIAGNAAFTANAFGPVLVAPNGTCWRLGVTNAGAVTTTAVGVCP